MLSVVAECCTCFIDPSKETVPDDWENIGNKKAKK